MLILRIGGRSRGILFGPGSFARFEEATGKNVASLDLENLTLPDIAHLIHAGMESAAIARNEAINFDYRRVCSWLDQMTTHDLGKVFKYMGGCMTSLGAAAADSLDPLTLTEN